VLYLILAIVLVVIIAGGVYAYVSSLPPSIEYAKLSTSKGTIEVELYRSLAPTTVDNFVSLAKSGFYNNLVWHRIYPGFVIQTGDPTTRNGGGTNSTWGSGQGPQRIPFENVTSLHNYAGYLAMARVGSDFGSATSQFFVNLSDNSGQLDGKYAVFGNVISGMDAVNAIASVPIYHPPDGQPIAPYPFLVSVTISNSP
jgi:dolichyl-diphosphooligosaccharide--protein glycosyltransferase